MHSACSALVGFIRRGGATALQHGTAALQHGTTAPQHCTTALQQGVRSPLLQCVTFGPQHPTRLDMSDGLSRSRRVCARPCRRVRVGLDRPVPALTVPALTGPHSQSSRRVAPLSVARSRCSKRRYRQVQGLLSVYERLAASYGGPRAGNPGKPAAGPPVLSRPECYTAPARRAGLATAARAAGHAAAGCRIVSLRASRCLSLLSDSETVGRVTGLGIRLARAL